LPFSPNCVALYCIACATGSYRWAGRISWGYGYACAPRQISSLLGRDILRHSVSERSPRPTREMSVTVIELLQPGQEHLLLSASEADSSVKLRDIRTTQSNPRSHRIAHPTPASYTASPTPTSPYAPSASRPSPCPATVAASTPSTRTTPCTPIAPPTCSSATRRSSPPRPMGLPIWTESTGPRVEPQSQSGALIHENP